MKHQDTERPLHHHPSTQGLHIAFEGEPSQAWIEFFRLCRELAQTARERRRIREAREVEMQENA
jgi:hypothetical protein